MKRTAVIVFAAGTVLALFVYWLAGHTEWTDAKIPLPLRGEARTDPFYAAERLTEALRAHATRDRVLLVPPVNAVIVLSAWNWSLSTARHDALERWVESGGRLVIDRTLIDGNRDFERWSRIVRKVATSEELEDNYFTDPCHRFEEERDGARVAESETTGYWICDVHRQVSLTSTQNVQWALRDASGVQAMRVAIGRGSVTVINADPFRYSSLLDGDHGALLVAAAQLRRGDDVHFLSEEDHPSLLALIWLHGAPVVALTAALVALVLWRRAVRFGPLVPAQILARRSLGEQIRGTGQFTLRHGGGRSLHAACVRALDDAARRRINRYARLHTEERAASLARLTDVDEKTIASAIDPADARSAHDLCRTIAVLETVRRGTIIQRKRLSRGIR